MTKILKTINPTIDKIYLITSLVPFDYKARIHVSLDDLSFDNPLCKRNLTAGRFSILTVSGFECKGEGKCFPVADFLNMPEACKQCKIQLVKINNNIKK